MTARNLREPRLRCSVCGKTTGAKYAAILQGWYSGPNGTRYCSSECVSKAPRPKGRARPLFATLRAPEGSTVEDVDRWAKHTAGLLAKLAVEHLLDEQQATASAPLQADQPGAAGLSLPLPKLRRSGDEHFKNGSAELPFTVHDFWAWSSSDLLSNALRGRVAEFLVAQAIGVAQDVRREWDAWDLTSRLGTTVEVKSSAYVQTWAQRRPSTPAFDIGTSHGWNEATAILETDKRRQAAVYVFALLAHRDRATIDPLDLMQWEFFVLPSVVLNAKVPRQKSIRLAALLKLGALKCGFEGLERAIEAAVRDQPTTPG